MGIPKYNFIINCIEDDLKQFRNINLNERPDLIKGANLEWTLQAYLILRERKHLDVICSNSFVPGCINIIHSDDLIKLKGTAKDFIVCLKGEFPWRKWAHY